MKLFEKTLTSETKFEGRIIKVLRDTVELENGKTSAREVVCHNGGVWRGGADRTKRSAACAPIPVIRTRKCCWSCPPANWKRVKTRLRP